MLIRQSCVYDEVCCLPQDRSVVLSVWPIQLNACPERAGFELSCTKKSKRSDQTSRIDRHDGANTQCVRRPWNCGKNDAVNGEDEGNGGNVLRIAMAGADSFADSSTERDRRPIAKLLLCPTSRGATLFDFPMGIVVAPGNFDMKGA